MKNCSYYQGYKIQILGINDFTYYFTNAFMSKASEPEVLNILIRPAAAGMTKVSA